MPANRARSTLALVATLGFLAGCAGAASSGGTAAGAPGSTTTPSSVDGATTATDTIAIETALATTHADPADEAWDEGLEVAVTLADGASDGGAGVEVDGNLVTITRAGTYRLRGALSDGQVVVDAPDEGLVRLVLDGVDVASSTGSPLAILDAGRVVVILAGSSQNTLADAATYVFPGADVDEPNAALFSAADLTIAGDGDLTVTGRFNDGISSKDGLVVTGGTIVVQAADDGIRGKDYLVVTGGTLDVTAGGDALKADNAEDTTLGYVRVAAGTVSLAAGADAVEAVSAAIVDGGALSITAGDDAIHAEARVEVNGGTIDVARSHEGLEGTQIVITDGDVSIVAEDDGLNVAGGVDGSGFTAEGGLGAPGGPGGPGGGPGGEAAIDGYYAEVSGGTIVIDAGGDGFDSNGSATVTGGTIVVNGPLSNGNGAIDVNGELLISDATLVAAGSLGMAETPSASSAQATLHLAFDSLVTAGTVVRVQAPDGTDIVTYQAQKSFQSLVVSTPSVAAGTSYDVLTGGTVSGETLGGYYPDPVHAGGTVVGTVTATTR